MTDSWIIAGARTPVGRFLGDYSGVPAAKLGATAIASAVQRASIGTEQVDEVIMGQVLSAGSGQAPARQASLGAGISSSVGCVTVNKVCGSSLYAVMMADRAIRAGDCNVVVAGGMESMSSAPHLIRNARTGWKFGAQQVSDAIELDGLCCAHGHVMMGTYADDIAKEYAIDRLAQDQWALDSHRRAVAAQSSGMFSTEIAPVRLDSGQEITLDSGPRADTDLTKLAKLKPAFNLDGTVTAGNSSTLSDGAAAVVVVSRSQRQAASHLPAFRILGTQVHAGAPKDLFTAPALAIERLLIKTRKSIQDVDLIEINEAFASQTLACMQALKLSPEKLNVHGGAIALGHPLGCSGARLLVTLMHSLVSYRKSIGVAALCLGGGEAVALMIEVSV